MTKNGLKIFGTGADLSALKIHVKCELSDMIIKVESLIKGAFNNDFCQPSEIKKENLSKLSSKRTGSQIKIEEVKSTRRQTIIVASSAKSQSIVGSNQLAKQKS